MRRFQDVFESLEHVLEAFKDVLAPRKDVLEVLEDVLETRQDLLEVLKDGLACRQDVSHWLQAVLERRKDGVERRNSGFCPSLSWKVSCKGMQPSQGQPILEYRRPGAVSPTSLRWQLLPTGLLAFVVLFL